MEGRALRERCSTNSRTRRRECETIGGTIKDLVMTLRDSMDRTYNHRLNLGPTMDEHAHPMSSRLIMGTVVGQNERKIRRTFICIRKKVPLLLGLKMDLVGTGAETAKLREMISSILSRNGGSYTHALESPQQRKWKTTVRGKGLSMSGVKTDKRALLADGLGTERNMGQRLQKRRVGLA